MLKIRSSFLLLAIALAMFSYLYFYDRSQKSTDETESSAKKIFEGMDLSAIDSLELSNNGIDIVLVKKDGQWMVEKPVSARAENGAVEKMLSQLQLSESRRVIPFQDIDPANVKDILKQWGLESPSLKVSIGQGAQTYELLIGRKTAVSETYYARTSLAPDAPVRLITEFTKKAADKQLDDFRSRDVFTAMSPEISRINLRQSKDGQPVREMEAARSEDKWALQKPLAARADARRVRSWLASLLALKVSRFVTEDNSNPVQYGLATPAAQILIQTDPGDQEQTLLIGGVTTDNPDEVYAKRLKSSTIFTLKKEVVEGLAANLPEVRDRQVLVFDPRQVRQIRMENHGKVFGAQQKESGWEMVAPDSGMANPAALNDLFQTLTGTTAVAFVRDTGSDLKSFGLDKPVVRVTLQMPQSTPDKLELLLGRTEKKQVYAMNSSEPFVYAVDAGILDQLPKDVLAWRDLQVLALDKEKIKSLTVMTLAGDRTVFTHTGPGKYQATVPGKIADETKVDMQLSLLSHLRAVRWLGPAETVPGMKTPVYRFEMMGETPTVIRIGSPLPNGGRAAQLEGNGVAFEVSPGDFQLLDEIPLKTAPTPAPTATTPLKNN